MRATYWRRDRRAKQRKLVLPINGLQASGISTLTGLAAALNVPSFFRCTNSVAESTRTPAERQAEERVLSKALSRISAGAGRLQTVGKGTLGLSTPSGASLGA